MLFRVVQNSQIHFWQIQVNNPHSSQQHFHTKSGYIPVLNKRQPTDLSPIPTPGLGRRADNLQSGDPPKMTDSFPKRPQLGLSMTTSPIIPLHGPGSYTDEGKKKVNLKARFFVCFLFLFCWKFFLNKTESKGAFSGNL